MHRIVAVNGGVIPGQVRVAVPGGISVRPVGADQTPFSVAVVVAQGQFPFPGQVQIDLGIDVGGFVVIVAQIRIGLLMAGTDAYAQGIPFLGVTGPYIVEVVDTVPAAGGGVEIKTGIFGRGLGIRIDDSAQGVVAVFNGTAALDDFDPLDIIQGNGTEVDIVSSGVSGRADGTAVKVEHDPLALKSADGNHVSAVPDIRFSFKRYFRVVEQVVGNVVAPAFLFDAQV